MATQAAIGPGIRLRAPQGPVLYAGRSWGAGLGPCLAGAGRPRFPWLGFWLRSDYLHSTPTHMDHSC